MTYDKTVHEMENILDTPCNIKAVVSKLRKIVIEGGVFQIIRIVLSLESSMVFFVGGESYGILHCPTFFFISLYTMALN